MGDTLWWIIGILILSSVIFGVFLWNRAQRQPGRSHTDEDRQSWMERAREAAGDRGARAPGWLIGIGLVGGIVAFILLWTMWPFSDIRAENPLLYIGAIIVFAVGMILASRDRPWKAFGQVMTVLGILAFVGLLWSAIFNNESRELVDDAFQVRIEAVSSETEAEMLFRDVMCEEDWQDKALATWLDQIPAEDFSRRRQVYEYAHKLMRGCQKKKGVTRTKGDASYNPFKTRPGVPHLWATQDTVKHAWLIGETRLGASEENKKLIRISHCGDPDRFVSLAQFLKERDKHGAVKCIIPYFKAFSSTGDSLLFIAEG